ncbi:MAG: hypothetical protein AVDCRST_MAG53-354 [uncultured Solirubrobacteraceae bacterium]|uniref:Uncharacterized protein n=1 Tax=uncultured Solirubrobacteraceae bacterium TaxID=1162706 RepID=A0A6J4RMV2_9ACTN|nr:MAG: hypothetical protein AVDCRST_MAG53-354 [uncultured Solirubrobacteraceae bacterium]
MTDERPDPPPEPPKRPQPDPLKQEQKGMADRPTPTRPEPDKMRRIEESEYRGGDSDGG